MTGRFPWFDRVDRPDVLGKRCRPTRYYVSRHNHQAFGDSSQWETWSEASRVAMQALANRSIDAENARLEQVFLASQQRQDDEQKFHTRLNQTASASFRLTSTSQDQAHSAFFDVHSSATSAGSQFGTGFHQPAAPSHPVDYRNTQLHHSPPLNNVSSQSPGAHSSRPSGYATRPTESHPSHTVGPNNEIYPTPTLPQPTVDPRVTAHYAERGLRWIEDFENSVPLLSQPEVFAALSQACMAVSSSAADRLRRSVRRQLTQPYQQAPQMPMDEFHFPPSPAVGNWAVPQHHQPTVVAPPPAYPGMYDADQQFLNPTQSTAYNQPRSPMQGPRESASPFRFSSRPPTPQPDYVDQVNDDMAQNNLDWTQYKQSGYLSATSASSAQQKSAACHLCKSTQKLARCTSGHGQKQDAADNAPPCQTQNIAPSCLERFHRAYTHLCRVIMFLFLSICRRQGRTGNRNSRTLWPLSFIAGISLTFIPLCLLAVRSRSVLTVWLLKHRPERRTTSCRRYCRTLRLWRRGSASRAKAAARVRFAR